MKPAPSFSRQRVAVLVSILWCMLIWLRAVGLLSWPWLALALPVVAVVALLVAFMVVCGVGCLLLRLWLWLVHRAYTRRRDREIRQFHRAVEDGFCDLLDRPLPRHEEVRRG